MTHAWKINPNLPNPKWFFPLLLIFLIIYFFLIIWVQKANAEVLESKAIRAVIGEASNQGYQGMLAVACGIRNRGTLKGVYGLNAKHVDSEPGWVWEMALKAWKSSETIDIVKGADHWENLAYGKPYWAESMTKTVKIGCHTFWKESK